MVLDKLDDTIENFEKEECSTSFIKKSCKNKNNNR